MKKNIQAAIDNVVFYPIIAMLLGWSFSAFATEQVRVVWDSNPSTQAVVGFSSSAGDHILMGTTTNETGWQQYHTTVQRKFRNSSALVSNFVRLSNLTPATEYYFKICSNTACGVNLYYFKTSHSTPQDMTVISGGDSRSSHAGRQEGNKLVAKIRPEFITFGGDFTNSNGASDMSTWLDHWQQTFSDDQIDGKSFKRVYPIIPAHGNHENNNKNTLCETFGVDTNGDGQCTKSDNYYAISVGGDQVRIYTLNTELKNDSTGWSQQKSWLESDLASAGSRASWRMGHYHRSMIPTGGGKTAYPEIYQWASSFYNGKMNLIVESDTHIVKYTWPVIPDGSRSYVKADAGTVYLGEGSWGVGTRGTDTPENWLADNASFKQFKILQFVGDKIAARTVKFSGQAGTGVLTRAQRNADPLALPTGLSLWDPRGSVGTVYTLSKNTAQLTQVDTAGPGNQPPVAKFSYTANALDITFNNQSTDPENQPMTYAWSFGDGSTSTQANPVHSYSAEGTYTVELTATDSGGLSGKFTDNVQVSSTPGGIVVTEKFDADVPQGQWVYYGPFMNTAELTAVMTGTGDADLYLRNGAKPTSGTWDCRPYNANSNETCTSFGNEVHIGVYGYSSQQTIHLEVTYTN